MLNLLFIEADNQRNLGGSCTRDIKNMKEKIEELGRPIRQVCILTVSPVSFHQYFPIEDYHNQCTLFYKNVKNGDNVIIMLAGHGYQKQSKNDKEKDRMDEHISFDTGIIEDNYFRELVEKLIEKNPTRIICLADTCHSGTMFDLDQICPRSNISTILSLSACQDRQYASCDISSVGFGGALTVHLLDIKNSIRILLDETRENIQIKIVSPLESILSNLGQQPAFYFM
jgi:hypothetical protein